jgi:hypothetical protein
MSVAPTAQWGSSGEGKWASGAPSNYSGSIAGSAASTAKKKGVNRKVLKKMVRDSESLCVEAHHGSLASLCVPTNPPYKRNQREMFTHFLAQGLERLMLTPCRSRPRASAVSL